jgi:uncharacterized membrane protein
MEPIEGVLVVFFSWIRISIEIVAALTVVVGVAVVVGQFVQARRAHRERGADYRFLRLTLSQHLAMALELLLAADILATSLSPSWTELGELAVIATIRTGLNYFLEREMREMTDQGLETPHRPWSFAGGPDDTTESAEARELGDGRTPA